MIKLLLPNDDLTSRIEARDSIPVDQVCRAPSGWCPPEKMTTLAGDFLVSEHGTYNKKATSTLHFLPSEDGWKFKRTDQPEQLPIAVDIRNVWTASRSIVLRSGCPHNYIRMTEHIIAHRLGLGLDCATVSMETGDPPLFNVGSMPIVDGIRQTGLQFLDRPARTFTVKEPVAITGPHHSFLLFEPPDSSDSRLLQLDVAIDFPTAIGKQRIQFDLTPEIFSYGAQARTNCSRWEMFLFHTVGKLLADYRNMGYTKDNILVAGKKGYCTKPALIHQGKSLEAVWHRACLDLIAALSLFPLGRLAGRISSYKAGHSLDCRFMTLLTLQDFWKEM